MSGPNNDKSRHDIGIDLITDARDVRAGYEVCRSAFIASNDVIWTVLHPACKTREGQQKEADQWVEGYEKARGGKRALTHYIKATVPADGDGDSHGGARSVVGFAIWNEASMAYNPPAEHLSNPEKRYPDDERARHFAELIFQGFMDPRIQLLKQRASRDESREHDVEAIGNDDTVPPAAGAMIILELIGVHPDHQGKGIARKLVQWGLDKAKARAPDRGGLDCMLEASPMGRHVYSRMGFHNRGPISFAHLSQAGFEGREPDLLFMETSDS